MACKPPTIKMSMLYLKFYNTKHKCINNFHLAVQTRKNLLRKLYRKRERAHTVSFVRATIEVYFYIQHAVLARSALHNAREPIKKERECCAVVYFFPLYSPSFSEIFLQLRALALYIYTLHSQSAELIHNTYNNIFILFTTVSRVQRPKILISTLSLAYYTNGERDHPPLWRQLLTFNYTTEQASDFHIHAKHHYAGANNNTPLLLLLLL